MCANVSEQVQNKAKFIAEKVNFLEKCETEMQGILEGYILIQAFKMLRLVYEIDSRLNLHVILKVLGHIELLRGLGLTNQIANDSKLNSNEIRQQLDDNSKSEFEIVSH